MANQADSRDGIPRKDGDRPSPDVGGNEKRPTLTLPKGEEKGTARTEVNLDDDDMVHPRGKVTGAGGTQGAKGGDSAPLGPPGAGLSDRNGPSDPDSKKQ